MDHSVKSLPDARFDGSARVVETPTFPAPWSGLPAVVVVWRFSSSRGHLLASGALGEVLVLDTAIGLVEVPLAGTEFVLAPPTDNGEPVTRPIPSVFEPVLPRLTGHAGYELHAREDRLVGGDSVHLVAEALLSARGDAYRTAARPGPEVAWRVDAARGRCRVVGSWLPVRG